MRNSQGSLPHSLIKHSSQATRENVPPTGASSLSAQEISPPPEKKI